MRPRRIARRLVQRFRNWNTPHVHCPACGSDHPLPQDGGWHTCWVCGTRYFRMYDEVVLDEVIDERVQGQRWVKVVRPLVVDTPDPSPGGRLRGTTVLGTTMVYVPAGPMEPMP